MTGKPLLDKIVMALNVLGLLFSLGAVIYSTVIWQKPLPKNEEELRLLRQEALTTSFVETIPMKKITINLPSQRGRLRYLDIEMGLLPFKSVYIDKLKANFSLIYDRAIVHSGKMEAEELNSLAGKILLEDQIKKDVNEALGGPILKKIFFTVFVVQ